MQRETLSASSLDTLANNRRSFLLKFSERISTALEKFESKMKNFDTGICADLEIDMNSMVKIVEVPSENELIPSISFLILSSKFPISYFKDKNKS